MTANRRPNHPSFFLNITCLQTTFSMLQQVGLEQRHVVHLLPTLVTHQVLLQQALSRHPVDSDCALLLQRQQHIIQVQEEGPCEAVQCFLLLSQLLSSVRMCRCSWAMLETEWNPRYQPGGTLLLLLLLLLLPAGVLVETALAAAAAVGAAEKTHT
jgi:hypothetical protein